MLSVKVNGRFLGRQATGVDRFAIELLRAVDDLYEARDAMVAELSIEVLVPPGVDVQRRFRHIPVRQVGRFQGQVWEQIDLPIAAGAALLLNLCNTAPIFRSKQIVVIHDAATAAIPMAFSAKFKLWYGILMPWLGRRSKAVVTVSSFSFNELVNRFNISEKKLSIVSEGGEHILRAEVDSKALDKFDLKTRPFVLAVSSMAGHKNFQLVLRALELIPDPPFDVAIAGGANARVFGNMSDLKSQRVKWLGYVSDEELRSLYEGAICFVFPSLYEGFGIPPLEAMQCGCPVVASHAASMPEVCGDAALFFDPHSPTELANALLKVSQSSTLRSQMREAGFAQASKFSWKMGAQSLLQVSHRVTDKVS